MIKGDYTPATRPDAKIYEKFGRQIIENDERASGYIKCLKSLGDAYDCFDYELFARKLVAAKSNIITEEGLLECEYDLDSFLLENNDPNTQTIKSRNEH